MQTTSDRIIMKNEAKPAKFFVSVTLPEGSWDNDNSDGQCPSSRKAKGDEWGSDIPMIT